MNWIYDEQTPHSRLMVGYDRYGIAIREWSDDASERAYHVHEAYFTWEQYRTRERNYSGDDGHGRMKQRLVAGALSLMSYYGPSSDSCGEVDTLNEYVDCGHVHHC
jgi:hypothetical protein